MSAVRKYTCSLVVFSCKMVSAFTCDLYYIEPYFLRNEKCFDLDT